MKAYGIVMMLVRVEGGRSQWLMKLNDCVIKVMSKLNQRYLLLVLEQDCIVFSFFFHTYTSTSKEMDGTLYIHNLISWRKKLRGDFGKIPGAPCFLIGWHFKTGLIWWGKLTIKVDLSLVVLTLSILMLSIWYCLL